MTWLGKVVWWVLGVATLVGCGGNTVARVDQNEGQGPDAGSADGGFVLRPPTWHRATPDICSRERGPGNFTPNIGWDAGGPCTKDSDCAAGTNGRCMAHLVYGGSLPWCRYDDCFVDADCGAGRACVCDPQGNACVQAGCHVDADCGAGGWCSLSTTTHPCWVDIPDGYFCRTPRDACVEDSDCGPPDRNHCSYSKELRHWACGTRGLCGE